MKRYKQKLREVWLHMPEFRPWLRRDPEDSYRARCRFCKCGVNTKISDLRAHALTKKHMKRNIANAGAGDIKTNESQSVDEEEASFDNDTEYKRKAKTTKRTKRQTGEEKNIANKSVVVKSESRNGGNPDYEAMIESLALYEPEQALFSHDAALQSDQTIEKDVNSSNLNEEMISNAVAAAVNNLKDSSQIFGDFVADRLRTLSDKTAEHTKDKIMQVILEAAALDRLDHN